MKINKKTLWSTVNKAIMKKLINSTLIIICSLLAACDYEVIPNETSEPIACIGNLPAQCTAPCIINFDAACSENASSYNWDFGDGNTSTLQKGAYTFQAEGTYTISLEVSNNAGDSNTETVSIEVQKEEEGGVKACFANIPSECTTPCTINYNATCSENASSYNWDFGDGNTSDLQQGSHTYQVPGAYTIMLEVSNDAVTTSTNAISIQVNENSNTLIADFSFDKSITYYENCTEVQFINNSQNANFYFWDFGDGNTSTEENPIHKYINPASFNITLTATNASSITDETKQTISITPSIKFEKTFATGNSCSDVIIAADGGYLLAGNTDSKGAGGLDAYLIKTDANGNLQWDKTFGGSANDNASALTIAPDGGYLLAGSTTSKGAGERDAYLIKTDANGNLQWDKTYGGSGSDFAFAIEIAPDGGYLLAGETRSKGAGSADAYLIKTDANGNLQWDKTFGDSEFDSVVDIATRADGGYVLAGRTSIKGAENSDAYLIKTDGNGNLQWEKTYGGASFDLAYALTIAPDGGYLLAGSTISKGAGNFDAYLIKTDANGNLQWDKTYGGSEDDIAHALTIAPDGGYLLTGSTRSKGAGFDDAWLIKTDANGNLQWEKTYGGSENDQAIAIAPTKGCGYIIAGSSNSEFYLIKTDSEGNIN